jgi:hypothetical protein
MFEFPGVLLYKRMLAFGVNTLPYSETGQTEKAL